MFSTSILWALMIHTINSISRFMIICNEKKKCTINYSPKRKTNRTKYDPPYTKKPIIKGAGNSNHVSVEEVSLDGSNKLITYGNQFRLVHS